VAKHHPGEVRYDMSDLYAYGQEEFLRRLAEELLHLDPGTRFNRWSDSCEAYVLLVPFLSVWWEKLPTALDIDLALWQEGDGVKEVAAALPKYTLQILCGAISYMNHYRTLITEILQEAASDNPKFTSE
jgi:hypothetical protein